MKFTLFLGALALVVCISQAQPVAVEPQVLPQEQSYLVKPLVLPQEQSHLAKRLVLPQEPALTTLETTAGSHNRQKRATCDLLSAWGVNHTACAAHCLTNGRGNRGGYCNSKGVCICRR